MNNKEYTELGKMTLTKTDGSVKLHGCFTIDGKDFKLGVGAHDGYDGMSEVTVIDELKRAIARELHYRIVEHFNCGGSIRHENMYRWLYTDLKGTIDREGFDTYSITWSDKIQLPIFELKAEEL